MCYFSNESRNEQTSFKTTSKPLMSLSGSAIIEFAMCSFHIYMLYINLLFPFRLALTVKKTYHTTDIQENEV